MGQYEERKRAERDGRIARAFGISVEDLESLRAVLGTLQRQLPAGSPDSGAAEAARILRLDPQTYAWLIRAVVSSGPDVGEDRISTEVIHEIVANSANISATVAARRAPPVPTTATGGRRRSVYSVYVPGLQGWPANGGLYITNEGDHVHAWPDCHGLRGSRLATDPDPIVIPVFLTDKRVVGRRVCRKCVPNKIQADRIDDQLSSQS